MAEFALCQAAIVACHCTPAVLDAIALPSEVVAGRVAPDELLLIGPAVLRDDLLSAGGAAVEPHGGLAVDETDAWTVFCLLGEEAEQAFRRVAHVTLPPARPAFIQCPIAHVPGKVVACSDRLYVFAPAPAAHHVGRRLGDACGTALGPELEAAMFFDLPRAAV